MPSFCEAWAKQNEDGQGLRGLGVAQLLGLGEVGRCFVRVANLLVGNVPVVMQEQVPLAIRPWKHDALHHSDYWPVIKVIHEKGTIAWDEAC